MIGKDPEEVIEFGDLNETDNSIFIYSKQKATKQSSRVIIGPCFIFVKDTCPYF